MLIVLPGILFAVTRHVSDEHCDFGRICEPVLLQTMLETTAHVLGSLSKGASHISDLILEVSDALSEPDDGHVLVASLKVPVAHKADPDLNSRGVCLDILSNIINLVLASVQIRAHGSGAVHDKHEVKRFHLLS